jgi:outer membrane biosynthesis protein TonB
MNSQYQPPHGQQQQGYPQQGGHPQQGYQAEFQHANHGNHGNHGPSTPTAVVPIKVRTPSMVAAPFSALAREFRGLFVSPFAFYGGIFGTIALTGVLGGLFFLAEQTAVASSEPDEEEFLLDFEPGALTKLGVAPTEIPEKAINEETRTPEDAVKETVTEEEDQPIPETPPEKKPVEEKAADDKPVNKNDKAKISDKNRTDNNPYDDVPNNIDPTGDPFGDPNGWSDLAKDGDPWATSVMKALNMMKVPGYAGKVGTGTYKFKIKLCKDGKIDQVMTKGSSGDPILDSRVKVEVERLEIPPPPANVLSKMKSNCVTLNYLFSWSNGKTK